MYDLYDDDTNETMYATGHHNVRGAWDALLLVARGEDGRNNFSHFLIFRSTLFDVIRLPHLLSQTSLPDLTLPVNMSLCTSCHRSLLRPVISTASSSSSASSIRTYTARAPAAWKSRTHTQKAARIPNPLPAIYPQLVILSDGSSFTSYTTSPSPATLRLTRDVTNNPLWNPASEGRRGGGEEEGGRLARFRARFGANSPSSETPAGNQKAGSSKQSSSSFGVSDFDWMGEEAGVAEKVSAKEMSGPQKATKGKKK
jgi:hypothetical protein